MGRLERDFQARLIEEIHERFPGSVVLKNDESYIQGFPDLLVLVGNRWAALECKRSANAPHRPNQDYYIDKLGNMSFAAFIFPENKEEILSELQRSFRAER